MLLTYDSRFRNLEEGASDYRHPLGIYRLLSRDLSLAVVTSLLEKEPDN